MRSKITARLIALRLFEALLVAIVFVPQLLSTADPLATDTSQILAAPNLAHPLGTDQAGRDLLTRIIYGARSTVLTGLVAAVCAAFAGALLGTFAAFSARPVRTIFMRLTESAMALPEFLIALLIVAYTGAGVWGVTLAVIIATVPGYARIAVARASTAVAADPHTAAKVLGVSKTRRFCVYVLPAAVRPVAAVMVTGIGVAILMITGLTFLGLGLTPPAPDWGAMLSQSRTYVNRAWWPVAFPGVAIICAVAYFTLRGRALQQRWLHD